MFHSILNGLKLPHTVRRPNHGRAARRPRFETLEDRALLAITVNTLTDELDGSIVDGDISLRDAIAAAPVGETIDFSVTGAINLTLGQLTIGKNLTVTGPGANQLTINAGAASRVLEITTGTVGVSGLTLTGGNAGPDAGGDGGGGVYNKSNANTTLTGVAIQGNTAYWFGGGAYNEGTLTIADSTISGNSASYGGGVMDSGFSLAIKKSTISGNLAHQEGGGVHSYYGSATISNCTISGNSAHQFDGGGITIWNANAWISHSLITGNSAPEGSEIYANSLSVVYLNAFNLVGDSSETTAQALVRVTAGATDILATSNGTNPTALAAILDPLANNGGPTMTHALLPGSPAIDAGDPGFMPPPDFDQRGAPFSRVVGGRIDVGAFELQAVQPTTVSVSDATVTEGNTGTVNATFTVTLSKAAAVDVTVSYATADLTAEAGSDYTAKSGTVTIPAGQTSRTFTVAVLGDRLAEPTETFAVNLSAPTNASIRDGQAIGTILDDEPRISINDVSTSEGNSKTPKQFTFTVSLSAAYDQAVTVNYATASGTAAAGSDYQSMTGTVTFAPGETTKTITVAVIGDKQKESDETFFVSLSGAVGAEIIDGHGLGTILNDDGGGPKGSSKSSALAFDVAIEDWMSSGRKKRAR